MGILILGMINMYALCSAYKIAPAQAKKEI